MAPNTVLAITNIESQRSMDDADGMRRSLQFSVAGKSGNTQKLATTAGFFLGYRQQKNEWLGIVKYEYGESDSEKDVNNRFYHGRYIFHRQPDFAWEAFAQQQKDDFQQLESRALLGGGARWRLYDSSSRRWIVGAGAYYTKETFSTEAGDTDEDYARGNIYLVYKQVLSEHSEFNNTLYLQPRLSRPSDSYAVNSLALKVKLNINMALHLSLDSRYDSEPIENLDHIDHSYYTSLNYEF